MFIYNKFSLVDKQKSVKLSRGNSSNQYLFNRNV